MWFPFIQMKEFRLNSSLCPKIHLPYPRTRTSLGWGEFKRDEKDIFHESETQSVLLSGLNPDPSLSRPDLG